MSKTVDERVVEMRFDNAQFEKNVETSMNTIDKLKSSLKFDGIGKGIDNLNNSVKKIDMGPISSGIETVKSKFSAMEVMAITALANITNSAVEAGKKLVSSFTVDPIKQGYGEYELLMDSIKVIKASTGEETEIIEGYLNELNEYADKTIYTFSDMTQNIGKFTNAGVSLDSAVKAIQGISNAAAVSGANAQQASHSMYNFAQALQSGYVKLIDWKSIENANMATVEFKQTLLDTALALGTVVKEGDDYITTTTNAKGKVSEAFNATKGFNDALQHQWMTTDVLTQALSLYSTDVSEMTDAEVKAYKEQLVAMGYTQEQADSYVKLSEKAYDAATKIRKFTQLIDVAKEAIGSGWAQTFRILIGGFDESGNLWTSVGEVVTDYIDKISKARNETLQAWKDMGGRDSLLKSLKNIFDGIYGVVKPVTEAFHNIFPPVTAKQLFDLTKKFEELTSHFKISGKTADALRITFTGVFSVLRAAGSIVFGVAKAVSPLSGVFGGLGKVIVSITAVIGNFLSQIADFTSFGSSGFLALNTAAKWLADTFNDLVDRFLSFEIPFDKFINDDQKNRAINALGIIIYGLGVAFNKASELFSEFVHNISNSGPFESLKGMLTKVRESFLSIGGSLVSNVIGGLEKLSSIKIELPNTLEDVKDRFSSFFNILKENVDKAKGFLKSFADSVRDAFIPDNSIEVNAAERYKKITGKLASGLDTKGVSSTIIRSIRSILSMINTGLFGGLLNELRKYFKNLNKTLGTGNPLGDFLKSMSSNITGTLDEVKNTLKTYQTELKSKILMEIAKAIGLLAASVFVLSRIPADQLKTACTALASVAGILGVFTLAMSKLVTTNAFSAVFGKNGASILSTGSNISQIGGALVTFAAAIGILSLALKNLAGINLEEVGVGIVALGGIAAILTKTMSEITKMAPKIGANAGSLLIVSTSMILVAEAVKIMAKPIMSLGNMKPEKLGQGLLSVIFLVGMVTTSLKALENANPASVLASATAMTMLSVALTALSVPITILGLIPFQVLAQGLMAVGVGMFTMAGALKLVASDFGQLSSSTGKILASGAAMMMIAMAMNELMVPILILGTIPWQKLVQGMAAVVVGLAAMTVSLKILSSASASSSLGAGGGMMMIAAAMNMLLPVILIMGAVPWQVIAQGLGLFAAGLLALAVIGNIATAGAAGLLSLGGALLMIAGAFAVFNAGLALFGVAVASIASGLTILAGLSTVASAAIVKSIEIILGGLLTLVVKLKTQLLQSVITLIDVLLEGLITETPKIMDFINTFLVEAIATFVSVQGAAVEGVLVLVEAILKALAEHAPVIVDRLIDFITGIIYAVAERIPDLFDSIEFLITTLVNTIIENIKSLEGSSLKNILEFGGILSTFMIAMAGLSALALPAMAGVLAFGVLITELSIVLAAVGALNSIPGLQQFADKGGDLLQSVGTAIGKFIGGFIGGALEGITATLPKIGTDLSSFMMTIQPFITGVNNIDGKAVAGCTALAGMIIALTGTSVIAGIGLFAGGAIGFVTMGLELKAFGPMIADFAKSVEGINPDAVNAAANAGRMIIELVNNLPKSGGLADLFGKSMDMQEFGRQLDWFGYYIVLFSQRVDGKVSEAAVQAAVNAGKMISEMAKTIPNSGGVLGAFLGNNDMQEFGRQLDWFGYYLVRFSERVDGKISEAAVQASANAGKIITDLAKSIPNSGPSVVSFFVGDNDMQTFGRQLDWFGYYLASYSNRVANLSLDGIANSKEAALNLISMATEMETSAKSIRAIVGASLLSAFGLELELFGGSISNYSNVISGISLPTMQGTVIEVKKLVDLANDIAAIDTSVYSNFSNSLTTMANNGISSFVGAFTDSTSRVQTAVYSLITNTINLVNTQITSLYNAGLRAGQQVDNGMIAGMNGFLHNVLTTSVKVCTDFINVFNTKIIQKIWFDLSQINVMQSLINGMNTKKPMLISAATIICMSLIDVFRKYLLVATFTAFGSNNVMQSLINGMRNKAPELNKAAKEICDDLVKIFKEGLDPKKFSEIGEKALKGLIDSFNSESAKQKLREAVKSICDLIVKTFNDLTTGDSSPFVEVGKQISAGLAKGIVDSKGQVSEAIKKVIKEAVEAAKKESDEHSPSKVFATIGKFFDLGLAQGINNNTSSVTGATANLAESTIEAMRSAISRVTDMASDELDFQPTITPVIDLTNIQNGSKKLRGIITKGLNTSIAYDNALMSSPNMRISAMTSIPDDATESGSVVSNNYNFTQNNYSPKALSRKEIYRQTRNQFSALKGAVNRA